MAPVYVGSYRLPLIINSQFFSKVDPSQTTWEGVEEEEYVCIFSFLFWDLNNKEYYSPGVTEKLTVSGSAICSNLIARNNCTQEEHGILIHSS